MKWLFVLLLIANVVLGRYLYLQDTRPNSDAQIINLQMNADKIRVIPEPPRPKQHARTACLEWGSFGDMEMERVRAALSAAKLGERISESKSVVTANWWVYMPRQRSRARMERKANQLRELGINGVETITEQGRWQYAISLGDFRKEISARSYSDQLKASGVRTAVVGQREQQVAVITVTAHIGEVIFSTTITRQLCRIGVEHPGTANVIQRNVTVGDIFLKERTVAYPLRDTMSQDNRVVPQTGRVFLCSLFNCITHS